MPAEARTAAAVARIAAAEVVAVEVRSTAAVLVVEEEAACKRAADLLVEPEEAAAAPRALRIWCRRSRLPGPRKSDRTSTLRFGR